MPRYEVKGRPQVVECGMDEDTPTRSWVTLYDDLAGDWVCDYDIESSEPQVQTVGAGDGKSLPYCRERLRKSSYRNAIRKCLRDLGYARDEVGFEGDEGRGKGGDPDDHRGQIYNPITKTWSWF